MLYNQSTGRFMMYCGDYKNLL